MIRENQRALPVSNKKPIVSELKVQVTSRFKTYVPSGVQKIVSLVVFERLPKSFVRYNRIVSEGRIVLNGLCHIRRQPHLVICHVEIETNFLIEHSTQFKSTRVD